jgi:hypothetical protein
LIYYAPSGLLNADATFGFVSRLVNVKFSRRWITAAMLPYVDAIRRPMMASWRKEAAINPTVLRN